MVEEYNKDYIPMNRNTSISDTSEAHHSDAIPMQEKFEELAKVLKNIKKDEKILIIGDNDGDGIPASAIFAKILKKLGKEYKNDFQVMFVEHDFRNFIKEDLEKQKFLQSFNYIFLIDMSMDDYSFLTNKYICVIDHHKADAKVNLLINPMYDEEMKTKQNCSACALVYALYRIMFGENKILQKIAFVSSMLDWFPIGSLPYLNISKEDPEYFVNGGYIIPSNYSLATITFLVKDEEFGSNWIFEKLFLETDDNLKSIVQLPEKFYKKLNDQRTRFTKAMKKIFDNLETYDSLIFLVTKEKYREHKVTINVDLQAMYPNVTSFLVFENKKEQGYNISSRSQTIDLVKLGEFAKQHCKTLAGGGHSVAAGFFIRKQEFKKYKQLIIDNYNKFKK